MVYTITQRVFSSTNLRSFRAPQKGGERTSRKSSGAEIVIISQRNESQLHRPQAL